MSEQSTRDEMNAAIRAQRERHNVPRPLVPETPPPAPEPELQPPPAPARGRLSRWFRK
jgi:hypothetical protein